MTPSPAPLDLSKIRHELRTPINHILGFCDILLEEEKVPASVGADLRRIHDSGRHLISLIAHYFDEKTFTTLKLDSHQLSHELRTPVNHIIGYSELLQEQAADHGCAHFIPDLQKINQAAQTWLDLMEEHLLPAAIAPGERDHLAIDPGVGFVTPIPKSAAVSIHQTGSILVVDDDAANRDLLERRLHREGYTVTSAENGLQALKLLRSAPFDLVLLDLIMPGLDGYQVLARLKADAALKHLPVVMISALDQENGIARCVEMGAEDYIAKPFNPVFLRARIGACLEKKHLRDKEQKIFKALQESQAKIAANLAEAAQYVESLLPKKLDSPVATDYLFQPSSQLGGDIFGYNWIDDEHFAMYLLDVSGHGVGAALLSVAVMNVIRARTLGNTDFRSPAAVLSALNDTFPMENQNNLFFTIWYGVFARKTCRLSFASGGHPPALLVRHGSPAQLRTASPAIGFLPEYRAIESEAQIHPGDQLFILSDGVFELQKPDGTACSFADVEEWVRSCPNPTPEAILSAARKLQNRDTFEDDFSLLQIRF
jgi:sigma-B regulation protein RsbU (phosphoserine phosphatase)